MNWNWMFGSKESNTPPQSEVSTPRVKRAYHRKEKIVNFAGLNVEATKRLESAILNGESFFWRGN